MLVIGESEISHLILSNGEGCRSGRPYPFKQVVLLMVEGGPVASQLGRCDRTQQESPFTPELFPIADGQGVTPSNVFMITE